MRWSAATRALHRFAMPPCCVSRCGHFHRGSPCGLRLQENHTRDARACTSTPTSTCRPGECTAQYRLRSHALRHIVSSYMIRSVDRFRVYRLVPLLATSRPIGFGTSASRRRQRKDEDGQADLTERCVDNQASPRGDDAAPFTGACDVVATIVKVCRRVMGTSVRIGAQEKIGWPVWCVGITDGFGRRCLRPPRRTAAAKTQS